MTLVFSCAGAVLAARTVPREKSIPLVDDHRATTAKYFDALDWPAAISTCLVRNRRNAAVGVSHGDEDAIVRRGDTAHHMSRLCIDADGWALRYRGTGVDGMASLTDETTATDILVVRPRVHW